MDGQNTDAATDQQALIHHLPAGVVVHARDTRVLTANPQACQVLGLTQDQMLGRQAIDPLWALLDDAGQPLSVPDYPVNRVVANRQAIQGVTLGVRQPGQTELVWVLCNAYPVCDESGQLLQVVVTFVDVTANKRAREALRTSEERLQLILRGSNDAPWDWNLKAGEVFYAPRWWDMLGYEPGALPSDKDLWRRLTHPDDLAQVLSQMEGVLAHGPDAYVTEFRMMHRDGHYVPVESRGFILRDAEGRPVRISGVNSDLTERKQADLARRQLEAQLRESQKMESIGTLAGGIAHDFNNILGAILGHAALMREEISPGHPALDGLEQITRAGTRARDLVQQILAFSRRQPQQLKTQKMQPLLDETAALLRATLPARVTLSSEVQAAPLFVRADSTQLQQVLVNLCTNAWHALQGSTGQIVLGLDEKVLDVGAPQPGLVGLPSGAYVHLWVKDNGIGMDRATQARIFEPFFTTKSVGEGTGLGLSVVHGIVAAHRGVITVDSAPGKGSTFHVYLPAIQAASASPDDALAGAVLPACGQGQRIAYIDDDEVMTLMVERLLKHAGYQVSTFLDPLAALPVLQARPQDMDVVVTDFNMPQMSGVELAAHLRQIRPDWPIVISSGYLSDELLGSARAMGINALLQKQNTLEELAGLIQQVLGANVA